MHSQKAQQNQTNTIIKSSHTSAGNSSQRQQRAEWQKPTPTNQSKPASINRSTEKNNNKGSNGKNNLFLFNQSGSSNLSSNRITDQHSNLIGKNKTQGSSQFQSQNHTLESQSSLSNLIIDTVLKTENNANKTVDSSSKNVLSELHHKLLNFNNQKQGRNKSELSTFMQSFQPMSKTQQKPKNKIEQKSQVSRISMKYVSSNSRVSNSKEDNKENDKSVDSDVDLEDVNESFLMKRSNSQPKQDHCSPKELSLISYHDSNHSRHFIQTATGLESRNQIHNLYQNSQQKSSPSQSNESPKNFKAIQEERNLMNNNQVMPVCSKTPSEVFQYKMKSAGKEGFKSGCNILINSSQSSKNTSQSNMQILTSRSNQTKAFQPIQKSESRLSIQQISSQISQIEFDALNLPFLFSTQIAPPNSALIQTPFINSQQQSNSKEDPNVKFNIQQQEYEIGNIKTNIKVVARFRPMNKLETELSPLSYLSNKDIYQFDGDSRTVKIADEYCSHSTNNMMFTFDHVFQPLVSQEEIFEQIGQQTIKDIMNGYNGTIFAYGQTGSGKTFTMYGQDIFDEHLMGIVPRAARQIFNTIREQDLEVEYSIKVQMVEIYKETLRDLLHDSPEPAPELKIKEDPKRGTYIEGLNSVCIVSEEEIMTVLCTGETMRHVASTHLNQVSSRSHSICIIEVVQKYPNDSEKKGMLNLVDLAGSERVSKSHAKGQALEEAKKINFSLSMLGKVISCLTKNSSHIPYRDSKLTRLLKESLGGNNKTTLLVACSMHQSNIEETLSSLRFAQSAKFIQNKVKMNIKTSSDHLKIIIDQLKIELRSAKEEIYRLRVFSISQATSVQKSALKSRQDEFMFKTCDPTSLEQNFDLAIEVSKNNSDSKQRAQQLHNRPHQSLLAKNYDVIETNNQKLLLQQQHQQQQQQQQVLQLAPELLSVVVPGTGTPNFTSPNKNYEIRLNSLTRKNEELEMKLQSKELDLEALRSQKEELSEKVEKLEDKVITYKQKLLMIEKSLTEFESDKDQMIVNELKQDRKLDEYKSKIEIFSQQVICLEKALEDSDFNCQQLLSERQIVHQKTFKDFIKGTIKLNSITVSEALENYIISDQKPNKMSFISHFDIENDFMQSLNSVRSNQQEISLQNQDLLRLNMYSMELVNAVEEGSVPPEILIYLLKQQLIEASLANHNLQRILSINRWRQVIEFGKNKIKSELCKIQENSIETLENILDKSRVTHDKLRERVEKLENHLYDNRNYYGDIIQMTEGAIANNPTVIFSQSKDQAYQGKIQRLNTVQGVFNTSQINQLQNVNSSLSLGAQKSNNNQKSRFIRTITNKTLGKGFQFAERSPQSRASLTGGGGNMSILSHYYGQTHNPQNATPMRASGMNSPQLNNFQSPIRRHGAFAQTRATVPHINIQVVPLTVPNKNSQQVVIGNENQNFEEALQKYYVTNEKEEVSKERINHFAQAIQHDLDLIDAMTSLEEIKQYLRSKYSQVEAEKINLQPMFAQYQNACHSTSSHQNYNSQLHNSITNNNNLYASSNDYYADNLAPSITQNQASNSANDHQRQEHVMTLASEYLLTSNSAIYAHGGGLFNNNGAQGYNQYHQNDYLDRLQEKIVQLQEEVETQKCRAEEHKKAYYESKRQIEQIRELMEDKESKLNKIMKQEICQWENVVVKLKKMNEQELLRKQIEIQKLHELLAQWIENYQELEVNKGIKAQCEIEKLLIEQSYKTQYNHSQYRTLRHRRNKSNSSGNLEFSTKRNHMLSTQSWMQDSNKQLKCYNRKSSQNGFQFETMRSNHQNNSNKGNNNQLNQLYSNNTNNNGINCTYENYSLETNSIDKTKYIKGDNSPIDSCLDLDQSHNQEAQSEIIVTRMD